MKKHFVNCLAIAAGVALASPAFAQEAEVEAAADVIEAAADVLEAAEDAPVAQRRIPLSANFDVTEDLENILLLDLSNGTRVSIRLVPEWAPSHVDRIKELTRAGFYNDVVFHRVIDGFMAQTGDPTGTGQGGSTLPDLGEEFNMLPHVRGSVSMARAQSEDSANSQFFIVFYPRFALDRNYTNFGRVISGMAGADAINRGEPPADPSRILQASIAADGMAQVMPSAPVEETQDISIDMLNNSSSE